MAGKGIEYPGFIVEEKLDYKFEKTISGLGYSSKTASHVTTPFDQQSIRSNEIVLHSGVSDLFNSILVTFFEFCNLAVALVSSEGRILLSNSAAEKLFIDNRDLATRSGYIIPCDIATSQRMLDALALSTRSTRAKGTSLIVRLPSTGTRIAIEVIPCRLPTPGVSEAGIARVALVRLLDLDSSRAPSVRQLIATFGLSPAECRLATALASGLVPREIAEQYHISINTIRSQIKSVLAKTEVDSIAELRDLLQRLVSIGQTSGEKGRWDVNPKGHVPP